MRQLFMYTQNTMHIPGNTNMVKYAYTWQMNSNFIKEVDECMCHKEKEQHVKYYIAG